MKQDQALTMVDNLDSLPRLRKGVLGPALRKLKQQAALPIVKELLRGEHDPSVSWRLVGAVEFDLASYAICFQTL